MCDYQEYPESDLGFGDLQITTRSKEEVKTVKNWVLFWFSIIPAKISQFETTHSTSHSRNLLWKNAQF